MKNCSIHFINQFINHFTSHKHVVRFYQHGNIYIIHIMLYLLLLVSTSDGIAPAGAN